MKKVEDQLAMVPTSEEFLHHLKLMDMKLKEDFDKVKEQQVDLEGKVAAVKSTGGTHPDPHAPVASASASMHFTQRKGLDGPESYGGGHCGLTGGSRLSLGSGRRTRSLSLSSKGLRG